MSKQFKEYFEGIAKEFGGEYFMTEELVGGIGFSSLTLTDHYLTVPNDSQEITCHIEFCETAFAHVKTVIENVDKSKIFSISKKSQFSLLFSKNKSSLSVKSQKERDSQMIEKILVDSGLENIAQESIFDPRIEFKEVGQDLSVCMTFSMAFKDKEKVVAPVIEFMIEMVSYMKGG